MTMSIFGKRNGIHIDLGEFDRPFGEVDAESDPLLINCFEDLGYLKHIQRDTTPVISGPKGSGKSAIVKYLLNELKQDYFYTSINKNDIQIILSEFPDSKSPQLMDFICLLTIQLALIKSIGMDSSTYTSPLWAEVEKELGNLNQKLDHSRQKHERGIELDILKIFKCKSGKSLESGAIGLSELKRASETFTYFFENIHLFHHHIVLVDNMDSDYSRIDFSIFNPICTSLLFQATIFNSMNKKAKIMFFLREDILNRLSDSNIAKIKSKCAKIKWGNTADEAVVSLGKLMKARIQELLKQQKVSYPEHYDGWSLFYWLLLGSPESPGWFITPEKIIERTMWRPRDLIQFFNFIYMNFKSMPDLDRLGIEKACKNSERDYSNHFYQELHDSSHVEIDKFADFQTLMNALQSMKLSRFRLSDWLNSCATYNINNTNAITLLKLLYQQGAIGMNDSEYGNRWSFRGHYDEFNPESEFLIHYGLFKKLNIYNL
jgi:hypothetical protein